MGLIGGRIVGLLGGSLISLPAFGNHEWLASPTAALVGLVAGMVREIMLRKRRHLAFRPFPFSKHSSMDLASRASRKSKLGHAPAVHLRRAGRRKIGIS